MASLPRAACEQRTACKCCGGPAFPFGVVDLQKSCEDHKRPALPLSGIPIYYHRCGRCGFVFTAAFDEFAREDLQRDIYNDEYVQVDPDYRGARARDNAKLVRALFPEGKRPRRILDYGGGDGTLAEILRGSGFQEAETYDPFVPRHSARPNGQFDCVLCFEVLEHAIDPVALFTDLQAMLEAPGIVLFSTLLQPPEFERVGLNWWYAAPRNGHVSLFTTVALNHLAQRFGFRLASFSQGVHVLVREIPAFADHFLRPAEPAAPACRETIQVLAG